MSYQQRQFDRTAVALQAQIAPADGDGEASSAEIVDLSPGGAKLKGLKGLEKGAAVSVTIGTLGPFDATVAWVRPPLVGVSFAAPPETMAEVVMAVATYS